MARIDDLAAGIRTLKERLDDHAIRDPGAWTIRVKRGRRSGADLIPRRWLADLHGTGLSERFYAITRRGAIRQAKRFARGQRFTVELTYSE